MKYSRGRKYMTQVLGVRENAGFLRNSMIFNISIVLNPKGRVLRDKAGPQIWKASQPCEASYFSYGQ